MSPLNIKLSKNRMNQIYSGFDLETGDGLRYVYAWFKNDFYSAGPVHDSVLVDTYCEIDTFYWTSTVGDTLFVDDTLEISLILEDDNYGPETGGIAEASLDGIFSDLTMVDNGDGSYSSSYVIQEGDNVENGELTATFVDRANNVIGSLTAPLPVNIETDWERTFGGIDNDIGRDIQLTDDGGYIIVGSTEGLTDVYLIKTDEFGIEEWSNTLGGSGDDLGYSVQTTNDGGYIITGYTTSYGTGGDVLLIKANAFGNEQWHRWYGGNNYDEGRSVQQTMDRGFIIAGFTWSAASGSWDAYLIKTDEEGNQKIYAIVYQ